MPLTDASDGLTTLIVHDTYYEMVLHDATRAAVDSWITRLEAIWTLHAKTRVLIPLMTIQPPEGSVPLSYAFNQGLKLVSRFKDLPPGRAVFLGPKDFTTKMLDSFLRAMRLNGVQYRYMEAHERSEAVAWLSELGSRLREDG